MVEEKGQLENSTDNSNLEYSIKQTIEEDFPNLFVQKHSHSLKAKLVKYEHLLEYIDQLAAFTKNGLHKKQLNIPLQDDVEPVSIHVVKTYVEILWEQGYLECTATVTGVKSAGMIYYDPKNKLSERKIARLRSRFEAYNRISKKPGQIDKVEDLPPVARSKPQSNGKAAKCSLNFDKLLAWKDQRPRWYDNHLKRCNRCRNFIENN